MPEIKQIEDPSARRVVNSSIDTTNIATMEDQWNEINSALDMCETSLKKHCGPLSGYAMLIDANTLGADFSPNIFTRDGIKILSSIEFMSPLQSYIKHLITYVGSRVDHIAKDGTTTAMLFAVNVLRGLIQATKNGKIHHNLSNYNINHLFDRYINLILDELKKLTYRTEDLLENNDLSEEERYMQAGGKIAFMQAMSSSGGDVNLAKAMHSIFSNSPKITWDYISSYNSIKENTEVFKVEIDEWEDRIRCVAASENTMNYALGTEYKADANVFCYPASMDDYSFKTDAVCKFLQNYQDEKPLVIISPHISAKVLTYVKDLNGNRLNKITLWQYAPEDRVAGNGYPWELMVLCAKMGVADYSDNSVGPDVAIDNKYIFPCKVYYHDTYMEFYDYEEDEKEVKISERVVHDFYKHPEHATSYYTSLKEQLIKNLDLYKDGTKKDGQFMRLFAEMLYQLTTHHRPTLRLGGDMHEQLSNISVVEDVQGAIMASLNHGFVINGCGSFYTSLTNININDLNYSILREIHKIFLTAIEEVMKTLRIPVNPHYVKNQYVNVLFDCKPSDLEDYLDALDNRIDNKKKMVPLDVDYPVLHPVQIYTEILRRTKELLLKVAFVNEIVMSGGVLLQKEKKHGNK